MQMAYTDVFKLGWGGGGGYAERVLGWGVRYTRSSNKTWTKYDRKTETAKGPQEETTSTQKRKETE